MMSTYSGYVNDELLFCMIHWLVKLWTENIYKRTFLRIFPYCATSPGKDKPAILIPIFQKMVIKPAHAFINLANVHDKYPIRTKFLYSLGTRMQVKLHNNINGHYDIFYN